MIRPNMEHDKKGSEAIAKAVKLKKYAKGSERGLIEAQAKRYGARRKPICQSLRSLTRRRWESWPISTKTIPTFARSTRMQ